MLLPAFNKIAIAFEDVVTPTDVGFKSQILNEIIFSLTKLKAPVKELLAAVSLTHAAEGNKNTMWTDSERYPNIADTDMASTRCYHRNMGLTSDFLFKAIQHIEAELEDLLKASRYFQSFDVRELTSGMPVRKLLRMPSLKWSTVCGDEVSDKLSIKEAFRPLPSTWWK